MDTTCIYIYYLISEQIRGYSEATKYVLKFSVTEISNEELESFINSSLTITGSLGETYPYSGGITLSDTNNNYTAFFDASDNSRMYPPKLECDLFKNGSKIGHLIYKMFESDGTTPVNTPQSLGGDTRTFTSSLSKITE